MPDFEKGHFDGLVDDGEYLRQSLLYKQILPRPVRRSFSEGGTPSWLKTICVNPVNLVKNTSRLSVFVAINPFNQRNLCPRYPRLINDLHIYKCRDTFTHVMSALQIHLFLQNKAKFQKVKSNVNNEITRAYVQMDTWSIRKNKAKTKPNKAKTNPISKKSS